MTRPLCIHVNRTPGNTLSPLLTAWLTFAFGRGGQSIIASEGVVPLTSTQREQQLQRLGLARE